MFNENKTKKNSDLLLQNTKKTGSEWLVQFLKRERELLLSRFPTVRTVGSLRAKK